MYRGEIDVHGLGYSPDHKTLIAISNGSNSVTFIDTATNKVMIGPQRVAAAEDAQAGRGRLSVREQGVDGAVLIGAI